MAPTVSSYRRAYWEPATLLFPVTVFGLLPHEFRWYCTVGISRLRAEGDLLKEASNRLRIGAAVLMRVRLFIRSGVHHGLNPAHTH